MQKPRLTLRAAGALLCVLMALSPINIFFTATVSAQEIVVADEQKISDTTGGLVAILDNVDLFGFSLASIGDLNGDGVGDIVVGAYADDDGGTDRGAVYILFLNANGTVKVEQKISDTSGGLAAILDNSEGFGLSVAGLGDLNNDGVVDIAVGAPNDDDGGLDRGAVHILFLNANGTVKAEQKISDTSGGLAATLINSGGFGAEVANIGDLDGDGVVDIAVGAPGDNDGGTARGAVYILFLNANGTVKAEQKISDTSGGFTTPLDNSDFFGFSVAGLGDLDGDGVVDIAVGADKDDDGGTDRGAVYILFLNANGTVKAEQKISDTSGGFTATLDNGDQFGFEVAGLGDFDGDGVADIAVSAAGDDDGGSERGAVYILLLYANGTVKAEQKISDTSGGLTTPLDNNDIFGAAVADLGDLDGDGGRDIAVGAFGDDDGGIERGAVYILDLGGAAPDTDGDGVFDSFDFCPNTPVGGTVNANGCPVAATDLSLVKTASVSVIEPGIPFNYTLTVSNNGAEAHNVTVIDNIPAGLTVQFASTNNGTVYVSGQIVTATWGLVPNGATRTVTINVVR